MSGHYDPTFLAALNALVTKEDPEVTDAFSPQTFARIETKKREARAREFQRAVSIALLTRPFTSYQPPPQT